MSGINGDKSRFNRERRQKIARRIKTRELLKSYAEHGKAKATAPASKPKPVTA